jgi:hypothetical protein
MQGGSTSRLRSRVWGARCGHGLVTDRILLTVPSGPLGAGVVALVLGGLGSRLDLPVDRIDELSLAATTVGASVLGDAFELELSVLDDRILLRIGPLEDGTTADVARRRVVESLVDGVATIRQAGHEWFELELERGATG